MRETILRQIRLYDAVNPATTADLVRDLEVLQRTGCAELKGVDAVTVIEELAAMQREGLTWGGPEGWAVIPRAAVEEPARRELFA